ncbi:MAG TPA: 4Fe-4S binding protein [Candidatus Fermentibacter sp.]|nr:4Fe-4S binding protein [Candidatus Fermentibacter sp.]
MDRVARKIIRIDRERCDGCGKCASACHEGAIEVVDGKARLVKESYCDGLGACIGDCPRGALTIETREADGFDEKAVAGEMAKREASAKAAAPAPACGCPSAAARTLAPSAPQGSGVEIPSQLAAWPVQIALVPPSAPFFEGADLLIAADCTPFAFPDFHRRFMKGRVTLVGCPKLDDTGPYYEKLTEIFRTRGIRSVEVAYMQVPCCSALTRLVLAARGEAGASFPVRLTRIGLDGAVQESRTE